MTTPPARRPLPVATGRVVAAALWQMLRGRRLALAGVVLLFLAQAATALVFPLVIGRLVDSVLEADGGGVPGSFWWAIVLLLGAAVGAGILSWLGTITLARLSETVIARLREDYVAAALDLPRESVEAAGAGDIVTRASDDIAEVSGTMPDVLPRLLVSAFTIVLVAGGLAGLDAWYLLGFALTLPLYLTTVRWYLRTAPPVYVATRTAQSERGQAILGTLTQLPTVTTHRLEERRLELSSAATWETARWAMRTRIVQNRLFGRLNLTEAIGLGAVLVIGIRLAQQGSASPGEVTAAALLLLRTVQPMAALLMVMDDVQLASASLSRLFGVAKGVAVTSQAVGPEERTADGAVVCLTGVDFAYRAGTPVLHGIDLAIAPGETVAVVGATGSGKSTLAALVAGVHDPGAGTVTRGVPATDIVTVTQETHVFAGTVRDNLTLATPFATDEEVLAAVDAVGARGPLDQLPEGLDTSVGAGGHALTPAQAQHLALARVLLTDPGLVVLDEATAEADTADTTLLDHAAATVMEGRATLVIAHRLSQAAASDRVVVLERGRVVESGAHEHLVGTGGVYAALWQARAGVAAPG